MVEERHTSQNSSEGNANHIGGDNDSKRVCYYYKNVGRNENDAGSYVVMKRKDSE